MSPLQVIMHHSQRGIIAKQLWFLTAMRDQASKIMLTNAEEECHLTKGRHTTDTKFVGKKGDFLQNTSIKQKIIGLITDKLRQCGCAVVRAENDADVDIVKTAVAVASSKYTTVVVEDIDLLVLLLYYTVGIESFKIYLRKEHNI